MRFGSVQFLAFLILVELLIVLINLEPADAFVTIPAPVAFAIITAAVKLKLILVKVMFAMRTLGKYHILQRVKRDTSELTEEENTESELLEAWTEMEREAERQIDFDLTSCIEAATINSTADTSVADTSSTSTTFQGRQMDGWSPFTPSTSTITTTEPIENDTSDDGEFEKMVSSLIGTMTKSDHACHILQQGLISLERRGRNEQNPWVPVPDS